MRRVTIDDLAAMGEELTGDRLAEIAGGLLKPNPGGPRPTNDAWSGTMDPPGSMDSTNGSHAGSDTSA